MNINIFRSLKVLIASKDLFDNWLQAGIKYFLWEHCVSKSDILVKCKNNAFTLNPKIYSLVVNTYYDKYLENISCYYNTLKGKLSGAIDLVISSDGRGFLKMPDDVMVSLESFDHTVISETWLYDIHFLGFDLTDYLIIDVGAFVGDTALYYAKRGAFIIAVEPLPSNYEVMLRNIELNPDLKPRIIPINVAIGAKDDIIEFSYDSSVDGSAGIYSRGRFKVRVRQMKLSTLIKEIVKRGINLDSYKIKVLKMDCKGCEYDVINEIDMLKLFDIIKVEYSGYLRDKTYHELKKTLEDIGFKCRVWAHNEYALRIGLDRHGMLTCVKNYEGLIR
jgi:FkbM family methyltransferase